MLCFMESEVAPTWRTQHPFYLQSHSVAFLFLPGLGNKAGLGQGFGERQGQAAVLSPAFGSTYRTSFPELQGALQMDGKAGRQAGPRCPLAVPWPTGSKENVTQKQLASRGHQPLPVQGSLWSRASRMRIPEQGPHSLCHPLKMLLIPDP